MGSYSIAIVVSDICNLENAEIEDLIPTDFMKRHLNRIFKDVDDEDIIDYISEDKALIPQIEEFARNHNIELKKGWKVELSKSTKRQILKAKANSISEKYVSYWSLLFEKFNIEDL